MGNWYGRYKSPTIEVRDPVMILRISSAFIKVRDPVVILQKFRAVLKHIDPLMIFQHNRAVLKVSNPVTIFQHNRAVPKVSDPSYDPSQQPCSAQGQRSSYGARPPCSFQDQGMSYPGNGSSFYNGVRQDVNTYAAQCQQPLSDGSLYNTNRSMDNLSGSLNYGGLYHSDGSLYSGYCPVHRMEGSFQNMQDPIDWNADRGMNSNGTLRNINGFRGNYSACALNDRQMALQSHSNMMTSQSFHPNTTSFQYSATASPSSPSNPQPCGLPYPRSSSMDPRHPTQQHFPPCAMSNDVWNANSGIGGIVEAASANGNLSKHTSTAGNLVISIVLGD